MTALRSGLETGATVLPAAGPRTTPSVPLRVTPSRRHLRPTPAHGEPAGAPSGRLLVDASRSALSPYLRGHHVGITVDGRAMSCGWGRTPIDLPVGRHLVEIEVSRRGWGRAVEAVPVAAGATVEVFYRAPALPRMAGSIGPSEQRTRGRVAVLGLALAVLLAVLGLVALATGMR